MMPLCAPGIFRAVGPGEGPSRRTAPLAHERTYHSRRATMTKEQLERLEQLATKVDELRGYL